MRVCERVNTRDARKCASSYAAQLTRAIIKLLPGRILGRVSLARRSRSRSIKGESTVVEADC